MPLFLQYLSYFPRIAATNMIIPHTIAAMPDLKVLSNVRGPRVKRSHSVMTPYGSVIRQRHVAINLNRTLRIELSGFYFFLANGSGVDRASSGLTALCTPGMGVNLWGASPLYVESSTVGRWRQPSTSRRQGRLCEEGSEGSPSAKL